MLIHAYRRAEKFEVEVFGQKIEFKADGQGKVVANVTDERVIDRLVGQIPEAFRAHTQAEAPNQVAASPDPVSVPETEPKPVAAHGDEPMVLTNGEQSVDIGAMTAKEVRKFAEESGVELPKGNGVPVAELRRQLFEALTVTGN